MGCRAVWQQGGAQSDKRRKSANTQRDLSSSNKVGVKIADDTGRKAMDDSGKETEARLQLPGRMQSCPSVCQCAKTHYLPFPGSKKHHIMHSRIK